MRATHSLIALSTLIFTLNANAGLFDSTPDFKCGREDAVFATQSKIRNDAVSKIQQAYLATPSRFYGKPLNDYISKVNQISLVLENVTTKPYKNDEMTRDCTAKVSLAVPADIMNYVASNPDKLTGLTNGGGKVLNNSVQWDNFVYSLSLADNGKDISVSYEYANRDYISESMAGVTVLALNKSELEKAELTNKLNNASMAYYESDRRLNELWKYLPDSVKAAMKKNRIYGLMKKPKLAVRLPMPRQLQRR